MRNLGANSSSAGTSSWVFRKPSFVLRNARRRFDWSNAMYHVGATSLQDLVQKQVRAPQMQAFSRYSCHSFYDERASTKLRPGLERMPRLDMCEDTQPASAEVEKFL